MTIKFIILILNIIFCSELLSNISFGTKEIKDLYEQKISDTMSYAIDSLKYHSDGYSSVTDHLASVRLLGLSQGMGDPTYTQYQPFANYRIYGFSGINIRGSSRQTVDALSIGAFLLPNKYEPDFNNRDINAHAKTIMTGGHSAIGFFFNPIQRGTQRNIYAILEFNFTGTVVFNRGCITIRHAFGEITWGNGSFLFGQYFHPLFLKECFPRVVNSNTGAPFEPRALVPQLRINQLIKNIELTFTLASQSYMCSWGPFIPLNINAQGYIIANNNTYIANSMVPNINITAKFLRSNNSYYGFSFDYLNLCPNIDDSNSNRNFKTNVRAQSFIGEIYAHNVFNSGEINMKLVFAQNGSSQLLISGYGISANIDLKKGIPRSYTPTNAISFWIDSFYLFKKDSMQVGLFIGAVKNLGAFNQLNVEIGSNQAAVYTLGYLANASILPSRGFVSYPIQLLSYDYRISTRYVYTNNPFRIAIELGFDSAGYGDSITKYAVPLNVKPVYLFIYDISIAYVY